MNRTRRLSFACLALLFLNSCEKNEWDVPYHSVGKFANRTTAEAEALNVLVKRFASLPQSQYYKLKYEFDDPQLPPELSGTPEHTIWYSKERKQLAVEFDIFSGSSCRWEGVDEQTLRQIADSKQGLEAANQLVTPANQQENCFKR